MENFKYCLTPGCKDVEGCLRVRCGFRYIPTNEENMKKIANLINEVQIAIDMLPPYDDSDWANQPDNLKLDVSAAKSSLIRAIKALE
jgi:hypothetical protein